MLSRLRSSPGQLPVKQTSTHRQCAAFAAGNIANLFLDEWIHADGEVDYISSMKKRFAGTPIELAACSELTDKERERQFFDDCKMHFENIRRMVTDTFASPVTT
jgi:hypothetical protein